MSENYLGNPSLKAEGVSVEWTEENIQTMKHSYKQQSQNMTLAKYYVMLLLNFQMSNYCKILFLECPKLIY